MFGGVADDEDEGIGVVGVNACKRVDDEEDCIGCRVEGLRESKFQDGAI